MELRGENLQKRFVEIKEEAHTHTHHITLELFLLLRFSGGKIIFLKKITSSGNTNSPNGGVSLLGLERLRSGSLYTGMMGLVDTSDIFSRWLQLGCKNGSR